MYEKYFRIGGAESSADTSVVSDSVSVSANVDDDQRVGQNFLEQFFGMIKALTSGGTLQSLVSKARKNIHRRWKVV